MDSQLEELREKLLSQGVAPRFAGRLVVELSQHYNDICEELVAHGFSHERAEIIARHRVGDIDDLADAMLEQPLLRSWIHRVPVILFLSSVAALAAGIVLCLFALHKLGDLLPSGKGQAVGDAVAFFCASILPLICGWSVVFLSLKRRLRSFWPIAALFVLSAITSSLYIATIIPGSGISGLIHVELGVSLAKFTPFVNYLLLTLLPYLAIMQWRQIKRERLAAC
ncbi:hypothetical protein [Brucella pituitosa]|uniref:hypothetical protein n=1 Tax=Brucella pituitosa TaxID=571256 RepID=UPI0009A193BD|nr:hypothetical protein [Brucella pituitosa]